MAAKSTKKRSTNKTKKQNTESGYVAGEIITWGTLAVSVLILISNFGLGGYVGGVISSFLLQYFGWIAYLLPFLLFGGVAFLVANKTDIRAYIKVAAGIVFVVLTCTLLTLIHDVGGRIGEGILNLIRPALGIVGSYVVVVVLMIICLVIITGRSFLRSLGTQGGKAYQKAKESAGKAREASRQRKQEAEEDRSRREREESSVKNEQKKRVRHRAEGVSMDTTLAGSSPEMREIKTELPFDLDWGEEKDEEEDHAKNVQEKPLKARKKTRAATGDAEAYAAAEEETEEVEEPEEEEEIAEEPAEEAGEVMPSAVPKGTKKESTYKYPPLRLLKKGKHTAGESDASLRETADKLQQILENFGVKATVTNVSCGPTVTRYELQPEMGVKVSKIVNLADDIKLNLAASDIRIEAPIPGKAAVGIEVPNKENSTVMLRDLIESPEFKNSPSKITFGVGKDIAGKVVVADIAKMPHLLIAGATGSGKSVCINTLIISILYKATPDEVQFIMIDPKVVELSAYNGIPHLMIPVVTDPKKAAGALNWAVAEMDRRYRLFADYQVRDITGFNEKVKFLSEEQEGEEEEPQKPLPQIVIIVDELADLMMVAPGDVESAICRLAQLARAAGIHLVLATQRPSVNVITGLIKANMPSRIAFAVSSGVDSRTIIDMNGAEKLLGKGDMLFYPSGYPKPSRVQGSLVSDEEVQRVVDYLKTNDGDSQYDEDIVKEVNTNVPSGGNASAALGEDDGRDNYFADAARLIIEKDKASIGMLQRTFKIGFNRAARIMDQLAEAGVVGGEEGTKPRKILMNMDEFEQYMQENN